jgi:hypothetical protein
MIGFGLRGGDRSRRSAEPKLSRPCQATSGGRHISNVTSRSIPASGPRAITHFATEEKTMARVTRKRLRRTAIAALALFVLAPSPLLAQGGISGSIAGVVRDTTGAVMPGVVVEAASPALIEKTREAVTDSEGLYKIIDLRPGTYSVTFTLSGFSSVRREGIELSANFTATVNAEMRVGTIEETLTVSGQAPTVDVQNVVQKTTVTRQVLDNVPIGKTFVNMASLTPAVIIGGQALQDMGNGGDRSASMQVHGSRQTESQIDQDGMPIHNGLARGGGQFGFYSNDGSTQEMMIEIGGMNAEHEIGGTRANIIPKEGGNTFRGTIYANITGRELQSDNLNDELRARGLTSVNTNNKIWDFNPNGGGKILSDRLWFYGAFRHWGIDNNVAGLYDNATPKSFFYTPDLENKGQDLVTHVSQNIRLTMQATQKNKVNLFYEFQYSCFCFAYNPSSLVSPEAQTHNRHRPQYLIQASWSNPATSRILFEAGFTLAANDFHGYRQPGVTPDLTAIVDTSKNFTYRAAPGGYGFNRSNNYNGRASVSYVTGSHSFKTGMFLMHQWSYITREINTDMNFNFSGTTPISLVQWATPLEYREKILPNLGLFVQDQWTINKMTLNLGVRYDQIHGYVPAQELSAGPWVGARSYAKVDNVPNYKDVSPRLGVSYDLFGNGKTAIKASLGRYLLGIGAQSPIGRTANPVQAAVNSVSRTWGDANGNYIPDCDLVNRQANGECGRVSDLNFGSASRVTTVFDPEAVTGFGNRGYNWEGSFSFQHELVDGLSVSTTYARRWYGNSFVTENVAVTAADFDPYCITAPLNPNLPGGGGNRICGFYDVTPSKFGQNNYVIRQDDGRMEDVYDGLDLTLSARLPRQMLISGGTSTGRERTNDCAYLNQPNFSPGRLVNGAGNQTTGFAGSAANISSPHTAAFCDIRPPFQTNLKFLVIYPLPWWQLQTSVTFQSLPGVAQNASFLATNALISPDLKRNLASGPNGTVVVDLVPPNTIFTERINQTNLRFEKAIPVGRNRVKAMVDLFNVFNASSVIAMNTRVGSAYLTPTLVMPARMIKFSGQWDF